MLTQNLLQTQRARSELFFSQNASPIQDDYHFVVKHIDADFLAPAVFGDEVTVSATILELKSASLTMLQEIKNEKNELLFQMKVLLVCLKGTKIAKIPETYKIILLKDV